MAHAVSRRLLGAVATCLSTMLACTEGERDVAPGSTEASSSEAEADIPLSLEDAEQLAVPSVGPVCPDCFRSTGGESGDFEGDGDQTGCSRFARRIPLTHAEALEHGFAVDALREFVERDFVAPFRWEPDATDGAGRALVNGYSTETAMRGSVRLDGSFEARVLDPDLCRGEEAVADVPPGTESFLCGDPEQQSTVRCYLRTPSRLDASVVLDLDLEDESLQRARLRGSLTIEAGQELQVLGGLNARGELADLRGRLRIEPPGALIQTEAAVRAELFFWEQVVRGELTVRLEGRLDDEPYRSRPLRGQWPDDACPPDDLPIDESTRPGTDALAAIAATYASQQDRINAASPYPARWRDDVPVVGGNSTEVAFELLGAPEPRCLTRQGEATFHTRIHFSSADGIVDWATHGVGGVAEDDGAPMVFVRHQVELPLSDSFWRDNLPGVDFLGRSVGEARLLFEVQVAGDALTATGELRTFVQPGCEIDLRCDQSEGPRCFSDNRCREQSLDAPVAWLNWGR